MILIGPGIFKIRLTGGNLDYVSASASINSTIKVWFNDELVEDVYIGIYSPHTWWTSNPIYGHHTLKSGDILKFDIPDSVKVRIEGEIEAIQ